MPVALFAIAIGICAATLLPGHSIGLNLGLVALAIAALSWHTFKGQASFHAVVFGALALSLIAMSVLVAAGWVLALDVLVAMGIGSLAAAGGATWLEVVLGSTAFVWRLPAMPGWLARPLAARLRSAGARSAAPLARGLMIGGLLLMVFGTLFATADRAFAQLAGDLLVPDWDVGLVPLRFVVGGAAALFAGAIVSFAPRALGPQVSRLSASGGRPALGDGPSRRLGRVEWMIALALLDLLFAAFVTVQVTVLFGGRSHVLQTAGLTYAEYARSGFFQLLVVAALTLLVLGGAIRWARRETAADTVALQVLCGILCALTLVILVSALRRLSLYEDVYGFTRLRLSVHATILWLEGIFGFVLVGGAVKKFGWLPRTLVAYTAVALLAFTLINPDRVIAARNVERYEATGRIDVAYLAGLSADAVPALAELPEPLRSCALADLRQELARPDSIVAFNRGRIVARETLARLPGPSPDAASCVVPQFEERY